MQATSKGNMPVVLLKEGGSETKGREAQKNNIAAAKIIAEIVHTSLGPRGMDKMLVDSLGENLKIPLLYVADQKRWTYLDRCF